MPDREPFQDYGAAGGEAFWRSHLTDPFAVRGLHEQDGQRIVRTLQPGALSVAVVSDSGDEFAMRDFGGGFFAAALPRRCRYRLRIQWPDAVQETEDPYSFGPVLGDIDLYMFSQGTHWNLARRFGAIPTTVDSISGLSFAVWAPNARRVSVVGDFNNWDGRRHPMRLRHSAGVWELFIPRLEIGQRYKFEIEGPDGAVLPLKADPIARATEHPPATASVVAPLPDFEWHDDAWLSDRARRQSCDQPISIYEVHAGSWRRPPGSPSGTLGWIELAELLIPYARDLGFTHIELMPVMEHPFAGSWGYQPLSQFAPSARFGSAQDFARFVDTCHAAGLGVILDWVPAHFPNDTHGLARFDGTALYEHADPREGFHPDWNTFVYNLGRTEVQGFLIASALWWIETFHVDGLRVDAVASMLYRDYSRKAGEWVPNRFGGRENFEAIGFLQRLNTMIAERGNGALVIAEESTAWPKVSAPVSEGGLGFSFKWNMGWMHDTLRYVEKDPVHRRWHHHDMTFGLLYAFSERFILPLSHDEVVYGKGSLLTKMPGDEWQKLATLRAYFAFMWTHPGKKLLFMGGELGGAQEWNHDGELEWPLLERPGHAALRLLVSDLNRLYASEGALHQTDCDPNGFAWLVADDSDNSVFAYARFPRDGRPLLIAVNMTPVPRQGYLIGVPFAGKWGEILNTDSRYYAGSDVGNTGTLETKPQQKHGQAQVLSLVLPPLATVILKHLG